MMVMNVLVISNALSSCNRWLIRVANNRVQSLMRFAVTQKRLYGRFNPRAFFTPSVQTHH